MHLWHYRICNISVVDCGALIPIRSTTLDLSYTLTSLLTDYVFSLSCCMLGES